jgi:hypothetical protein
MNALLILGNECANKFVVKAHRGFLSLSIVSEIRIDDPLFRPTLSIS